MWGIGIFLLAIFGIFLISLFGNITVTNQQDYTAMTNTVEAAMYDSVDLSKYRAGFCICTAKAKILNHSTGQGKWIFTNRNDYEINDLVDGTCVSTDTSKSCQALSGEYIIDKKVFAESLVRRFAESVKGNYDYQLIINDIIEYPPKASVTIKARNTNDLYGGEYTIVNEINSLIEVNGISIDVVKEDYACFKKNNNYEWGKASDHYGWHVEEGKNEDDCRNITYYNVTVHHYIEGGTTKVHSDDKISNLTSGKSYSTNYYASNILDSKYKDKYEFNGVTPTNSKGTIDKKNVEVIYYYREKYVSNVKKNDITGCKWHVYMSNIVCKDMNGNTPSKSCIYGPTGQYASSGDAKSSEQSKANNKAQECFNMQCRTGGLDYVKNNFNAYQYYTVYKYGTNVVACAKGRFTSASAAKSACQNAGKCTNCVAVCSNG